jgi:hypothetical protein
LIHPWERSRPSSNCDIQVGHGTVFAEHVADTLAAQTEADDGNAMKACLQFRQQSLNACGLPFGIALKLRTHNSCISRHAVLDESTG